MVNQDLGYHVKAVAESLDSAYDGASDIDGTSIDRMPQGQQGYNSAVFHVQTAGGTAGDEIVFQLQESDDDSTWSDVTGETLTCSEASDEAELDVSLTQLGRYVRIQAATADQTVSSTIDVASVCVLGGAQEEPA